MDQSAALKSLQNDFEVKATECEGLKNKILLLQKQLEDFQSKEVRGCCEFYFLFLFLCTIIVDYS